MAVTFIPTFAFAAEDVVPDENGDIETVKVMNNDLEMEKENEVVDEEQEKEELINDYATTIVYVEECNDDSINMKEEGKKNRGNC